MSYVPLWCKSNFSFLEGASHPDELVERAHALGIPALALTDRDGVHGVVRAHVKARELGVSLIVGAEITVGGGGPADLESTTRDEGPADTESTIQCRWLRQRPGRLRDGRCRHAGTHVPLRPARHEPDRLRQPLPADHRRPTAAAEGGVVRDLAGGLRAGRRAHRALGW